MVGGVVDDGGGGYAVPCGTHYPCRYVCGIEKGQLVRWERGRAIFTKWVAAYKLAADCTLGTGDASVAMLQGLSETLHHIYLQEIDMAGGLMTQYDLVSLLQASAALYVLGLRSELKRLSFVRARTPLFGGYASYVTLEHMYICDPTQ